MSDTSLPEDLRRAAENPSGLVPGWVLNEYRRAADELEASQERWLRMTGAEGACTWEYAPNEAEEPA